MSTNLKFITGLSGEAHVKPAMDAQWHSAINGAETFVYDYGQKFALTVNQAMSTMSIASGVGQIQGRLFIIEESLIETISYPNVPPEVGLTRIDTVLLHWGTSTRIINGETVTINTCEFEYKKNPLANGQPEAFAETDLNLGDTDAYYPMWHVTWNENGIQEVEAIFTVVDKATVGIDTTAPSGTVDGDLYSALVALGWENDVIDESLNVKKTLTKTLKQMLSVGSYEDIPSFPWTAPRDCMVEARVYPSASTTAYITFTLSDGRRFNLTALNGSALSGEILVKKGTVLSNYQHANLGSGSYAGYIPLNNL